MKLTGWALFVSKIEIMLCMIFGVHALKTGKHKKLAALWLGFEILTQFITTVFSWIIYRTEEGSWSKGFKKFKNDLDKEFGVVDESEWVRRDIYEDVEEERKKYKESSMKFENGFKDFLRRIKKLTPTQRKAVGEDMYEQIKDYVD